MIKKYIKEPFSALSHLFGALLSIAAIFALVGKSGDSTVTTVAVSVFGLSLFVLYLSRALTHGLYCRIKTAAFLERCDHAAIFFLIAGTYTPICLLMIPGPLGLLLLSCEWMLSILGICILFAKPNIPKSSRVLIYLCMGWLFVFAINPLMSSIPNGLLAWLIGGGLFYSLGTVFFLTEKQLFWPGYFDAHDLWHVFVLGGSACHFILINRYLSSLS